MERVRLKLHLRIESVEIVGEFMTVLPFLPPIHGALDFYDVRFSVVDVIATIPFTNCAYDVHCYKVFQADDDGTFEETVRKLAECDVGFDEEVLDAIMEGK